MVTIEEVKSKVSELAGKSEVLLVPSGDHAILRALKSLKRLGVSRVLIQDQGGWLTYKDYSKKLKLELIEVKTNYGLIDISDLNLKLGHDTVLLLNSMPGYCATEDTEEIHSACKEQGSFFINDVSGSIGKSEAKIGDIIVGSFGKDKPVNNHYGGFVASDNEKLLVGITEQFEEDKLESLYQELNKLPMRLAFFEAVRQTIINELSEFEIVHKEERGINVIVKYKNAIEQSKITRYCQENNYQYTLCPRYIRINDSAISIEVKRLMK